jgi:hypothetical protein
MPVKIKGGDAHLKRMKAMGPRAEVEASKLVYALADMHATEAALSITEGSVGGKNHVASLPGEPPNADTGQLDRSIHVERLGPLKARSVADAPHARAMEEGTVNVAERPYMRPAAKKVRAEAGPLADAAVKRIVEGGTL